MFGIKVLYVEYKIYLCKSSDKGRVLRECRGRAKGAVRIAASAASGSEIEADGSLSKGARIF